MPRKTKETENKDLEVKTKTSSKKVASKTTAKKAATKKEVAPKKTAKKTTTKKEVASKTTTKKTTKKDAATKATAKKASTKKEVAPKKAATKATTKKEVASKTTTKKDAATKTTAKKTATKKAAATKKTAKKVTTKKSTTKSKTSKTKIDIVEYYDLPDKYNQTIVKILAQTPTNLFIYWEISDEDRQKYKEQYGENFFETTKPILKIYNDSMNYNYEIEINDFANSWYLHVNDSKCDYKVELGRRTINNKNNTIKENYVFISSSNEIELPNDKVLIDKMQKIIYFRNVKTNVTTNKNLDNLSLVKNMGQIFNIYDLYKKLYKNEDLDDIYNPSSKFF